MKAGVCPKCNANEIYHGPAAEGEGLSAGSHPSLIELVRGKTHTTLWVDTYICRRCGYVEMHVANHADLAKLEQADGWEKVERTDLAKPGDAPAACPSGAPARGEEVRSRNIVRT
ncbi:MAG: hypothetical protein WCE68_16925 [Anaerolineales bacterium]